MSENEREKTEKEKQQERSLLASKRLAAHLGFLITTGIMDLSGPNAWKIKKPKQRYRMLRD